MDIHPVLSRVRQLELAGVMGNHSVSWVWVGLHWSAPFHWKPWDTRQEGIAKKEGVNWHYGRGYFLALPSGSFIHLKVQLFLTQPFNWMLSLATFLMALLYSEDVQWIFLWLLQWLWPRTHAMALSPPGRIRMSKKEATSHSKLELWCTIELSSLKVLPSLRKAKWFGDGFHGKRHLRATAIWEERCALWRDYVFV